MDPQKFINIYGPGALVAVGEPPRTISLGQALELEKLFCPADVSLREDTVKRLGYLAGMLHGAGSLRPEHHNLLPMKG